MPAARPRNAISMFSMRGARAARWKTHAANFLATKHLERTGLARGQMGCPTLSGGSHANAAGATKVNLRNGVFKSRGSLMPLSLSLSLSLFLSLFLSSRPKRIFARLAGRRRLTTFAAFRRSKHDFPFSKLARAQPRRLSQFQSREKRP